jgi:glyoxylase-like metal-dependent hydrolase (beta-lactamase superfamily II)
METHDEGSFRIVRVGPLGPFANTASVIVDPAADEAAVVDMPAEGEKVLEAAAGLRVGKILLTHTHPDHWFSYDLLKQATGAPVYCHPAEVQMPAERIDVPLGDGSDTPADLQQAIDSIVRRLYVLPDDTLVLPGHGDGTTIGASRREYAVFASRPHPPDLCGDVLWETA